MDRTFYSGNRQRLAALMDCGEASLVFSGNELHKSADAYHLFRADRNFAYLTGIGQKQSVLLVYKDGQGNVTQRLYLLPKDPMAERWTGRRLTGGEAAQLSGVEDVRTLEALEGDLKELKPVKLRLDLFKNAESDYDRPAHLFAEKHPEYTISNLEPLMRRLRTIKQPCEIAALRKAEDITREGILAMMAASRPGMYEYQYKAIFDGVLGSFSPEGPGFQPIISAGNNNFCIHYDAYTGRAEAGDLILNDVGAQWDGLIVDVSRSWPCDGKFTEKQRLLYECARKTSDYLFSIIRPGMKMADVDATIRRYNAGLLVEAGVLESEDQVGIVMWHGGAHHIGWDVHDMVEKPEVLEPGMVFCVDVGIYHEAWGIGFRLEDNCLVTEAGCENLSAAIPRTIGEIEAIMAGRNG